MRMNYLSQTPEEFRNEMPTPDTDPELVDASPPLARVRGFFLFLFTVAAVSALPYFLAKDFARVRRHSNLPEPTATEMARSSREVIASGENMVRNAFRSAEYSAAWVRLVWNSLEDFEDSMDLLKTPPDPNSPAAVQQRRRQGADQLVILLDRHGLLPLLMIGNTHEQAAKKIGEVLNINPMHVAQTFRDAQAAQIKALKEALDRHLSDQPGPSDLSTILPKSHGSTVN